ncbi:MAG: glutaredoxin domain-containing protein [Betaproteobacteria bacterium]
MRSIRILLAALFLSPLSGTLCAGTLVKITNADGRIVFTNVAAGTTSAPPSAATSTTLAPPKAAVPAEKAILFATRTCGYCRQTREYLARHGIAYIEHDTETESGKRAFDAAIGKPGVPVLVWRGIKIRGYDPESYDRLFAQR